VNQRYRRSALLGRRDRNGDFYYVALRDLVDAGRSLCFSLDLLANKPRPPNTLEPISDTQLISRSVPDHRIWKHNQLRRLLRKNGTTNQSQRTIGARHEEVTRLYAEPFGFAVRNRDVSSGCVVEPRV